MSVFENKLFQCTDVHGIAVNRSTMAQALEELEILLSRHRSAYVCFFEANLFSCVLSDRPAREAVNGAAAIYPDGIAPAKSAMWRSGVGFERVPGPSFILRACEYGVSRNWRHFFLGGAEGVADRLAENLKRRYPGLQIAGTYCPPFRPLTEAEEDDVRRRIEDSRADLLWVGLGGPKQEFWMRAHQGRINVPVMLGVGAAFDFHSGNRPWAPKIIRSLGLEWFWRMCSGGRKTFVRNLRCVWRISWVLFGDFLRYRLFRAPKTALFGKAPDDAPLIPETPAGNAAEISCGSMAVRIVVGGLIALTIIWLLGAVFLTSPTLNTYDPRLGFAHRSAGSWKQERQENWTTNHFTELGFEVHEQVKLHSGKTKIAIYGDSYIEAAMIPGRLRIQNLFSHGELDALGVGYSGIGAPEYCYLMRHLPKVVDKIGFHVIFVGDIYDFKGVDPRSCAADVPGSLPLKTSSRADKLSAKYRLFAFRALMRHWRKCRIDWFGNHWREAGQKSSKIVTDSLSAICFQMKAIAEQYDGTLLVVYAPTLPRISQGTVVFEAFDPAFGRELAAACSECGIGFIDLGPAFAEYFRRTGKFPRGFFNTPPGEGHLNEAGHAIAADALSRYFQKVY